MKILTASLLLLIGPLIAAPAIGSEPTGVTDQTEVSASPAEAAAASPNRLRRVGKVVRESRLLASKSIGLARDTLGFASNMVSPPTGDDGSKPVREKFRERRAARRSNAS